MMLVSDEQPVLGDVLYLLVGLDGASVEYQAVRVVHRSMYVFSGPLSDRMLSGARTNRSGGSASG